MKSPNTVMAPPRGNGLCLAESNAVSATDMIGGILLLAVVRRHRIGVQLQGLPTRTSSPCRAMTFGILRQRGNGIRSE
jgi:hypothetical protein